MAAMAFMHYLPNGKVCTIPVMKPAPLDILPATSVAHALSLLGEHGDQARLIAGGQSLMPILAMRLAAPAILIDINGIADLRGIRLEADGSVLIGALTRHRDLERSPLLAERLPLIAAAMPWIAHVQIRNRGTLGGSLSHADPAAELPALCIALCATIELHSPRGVRQIAADDFFQGVFATARADDELLTAVRVPATTPAQRWAFIELARRHGDFALCGIALTADCSPTGAVTQARIVVFGVSDCPRRLPHLESAIVGSAPSPASIDQAMQSLDTVEARSDHHASSEYRLELLATLARRALRQAFGFDERTAP